MLQYRKRQHILAQIHDTWIKGLMEPSLADSSGRQVLSPWRYHTFLNAQIENKLQLPMQNSYILRHHLFLRYFAYLRPQICK